MVAAKEVVLSSDCERSDRILDSVVVDVISAVKDITAQAWEKRVSVDRAFPILGFGVKRPDTEFIQFSNSWIIL